MKPSLGTKVAATNRKKANKLTTAQRNRLAETLIQSEQDAWEAFATLHPHEAFENDPDRFWGYFHKRSPRCSREDMECMLAMTYNR